MAVQGKYEHPQGSDFDLVGPSAAYVFPFLHSPLVHFEKDERIV